MENRQSPDAVDVAGLENAAGLSLVAFCWWRTDLPQDVCEDYWRDVHGIMFTRAPGLWQYRQFRLAPNRDDLWPAIEGVSFDVPRAAQPRGMPHGLFRSESDLHTFAGHRLPSETIPHDTRNFIGRIGALLTPTDGERTLVDRLHLPALQGVPPVPTFVLCFVPRAKTTSAEAFHRYLIEQVARPWSRHPDVLRLRVEPLPPYERSVMPSPNVPYQWPNDETYLGWIELAVRHEGVLGGLVTDLDTTAIAEQLKAVHTYPLREVCTLISAGRPTDVGLRGLPAVRTIEAVGAGAQRSEAVLRLLFGDAVGGLDRLDKDG